MNFKIKTYDRNYNRISDEERLYGKPEYIVDELASAFQRHERAEHVKAHIHFEEEPDLALLEVLKSRFTNVTHTIWKETKILSVTVGRLK